MNDNRTKDWRLFEAGKQYNNRLKPNFYETVNLNHEFVSGNQWLGLEDQEMPKPTFNILKRVLGFFIASLTSSKTKIHFEPLMFAQDKPNNQMQMELEASEIANAQVDNLFDKFKMDFRIKDSLFDAATSGDACAHFYFDPTKKPFGGAYSNIRGEISLELVDNTNVYFGNANTPRVDIQPYIIIAGRDMVQNLKEEAKRFKQNNNEIDNIQTDSNFAEQSSDSGKIEVEADEYGKALYIIVYRKKKVKRKRIDEFGNETIEEVETITASKSVENAYIYKDIDTGLSTYPVAWLNWEKQKNQYHGRALVTGIIPNQIFINRMFAMVMYHLMMSAFPKAVFNGDLISNWDNQIGSAIAVRGLDPSQNIKNIAGYLEPGSMSGQIIQTIELAMSYTKETLGISDAAMGNIDPKNTSAIIAVQKSSAIPLENPRSNLYEFIENIGEILLDFMGTYYGKRPVSVEDENGIKKIVEFDFSVLKNMFLNIRADVGEASYWSEFASIQTLDNLLNNGHLDIIDYLERVPVEYIPQRDELIASIKKKMEAAQPVANDPSALIAQLSPEEQEAFMNAAPEIQQKILSELQASAEM